LLKVRIILDLLQRRVRQSALAEMALGLQSVDRVGNVGALRMIEQAVRVAVRQGP
jgi:hypothetical protein